MSKFDVAAACAARVLRRCTRLLQFTCLTLPVCAAAAMSQEPILRIDNGYHQGPVQELRLHSGKGIYAIAGQDKVARIRSTKDGTLLATLRHPFAAGLDYHVGIDLSPDGSLAALSSEYSNEAKVYIFNIASQAIVRTLDFPSRVSSLAFSRDGSYLAVCQGDVERPASGFRLYDVRTGQLLGEDPGFSCQGISAGADGLFATLRKDESSVTLYRASQGRLFHVSGARTATAPHFGHTAFSPDGRQLLLAYGSTSNQVAIAEIRSVPDLQPLAELKAVDLGVGVKDPGTRKVGWIDNGTAVLLASTPALRVVRWAPGSQSEVVLAKEGADALAADGSGATLVLRGNRMELLDSALSAAASFKQKAASDYYISRLRISPDAAVVSFNTAAGRVVFDAQARQFRTDRPALLGSVQSVPGLQVTDWEEAQGANARVNGIPINLNGSHPLGGYHAVSVCRDGRFVVLASGQRIDAIGARNERRWNYTSPSEWLSDAVLTPDCKRVVATTLSGTVVWLDAEDGALIVTMFWESEKRWVMWAPSGMYDASPGAEDLIGWLVNRGFGAAPDFFPASRFRQRFFAPQVLAGLLDPRAHASTAPPQVALNLALLPPVVTVLDPQPNTLVAGDRMEIVVAVRSADAAPVTHLSVRINGQPSRILSNERTAIGPPGSTNRLLVGLQPDENLIQVFAENRNGVSQAGQVRLVSRQVRASIPAPRLYVLGIGISAYANAAYRLNFAAKDANDFVELMARQRGVMYSDVVTRQLTDGQATREGVLEGLDWLRREVTQRDVGMIFIAGHGVNDPDGTYYFLPVGGNADKLRTSSVIYTEFKNTLSSLAGKAVLFVDTCHSGGILGRGQRNASADLVRFINELSSADNGVMVFSSSTGRQSSYEDPNWENGAFTKALIEGFSGEADPQRTGRVTFKALDYFLSERVKALTHGAQTPISQFPGPATIDYPLAAIVRPR